MMSLDKAILHGKEKRKPYRGSKAICPSCRNHGSCAWCRDNRLWKMRDKRADELRRIGPLPQEVILGEC